MISFEKEWSSQDIVNKQWTRKQAQLQIKTFRGAGYIVTKNRQGIYEATLRGKIVMQAYLDKNVYKVKICKGQ